MKRIDKKTIGEMLRFGVVGVIATAIHYAIYLLLKQWILQVVAFALGYALSFIANFFMTARFTFRKDATVKKGAGFVVAHAVNFLLQTSLLQLFLWLGINEDYAPIPVYCIAVPVNFLLVRLVFR
ncbi:MAG: GtrA family protein [Prevotella sp.]|uniref:GtrA family protein n=1 Tax=Prevotella sp. TaxID=59823 RepID=UPI002A2F6058|nr:GtrA family protein [Prevotella sp.]MDD7318311.1 GtrA family protein [Prevotellaceae bacterium]MDY4019685.1 GtrA family protein [Prevotella sp.]